MSESTSTTSTTSTAETTTQVQATPVLEQILATVEATVEEQAVEQQELATVEAAVEQVATKSVAPHASMRPMSVKAPEAGLSARKLLAKFVRSCANQGRQTLEQGLLGLAYIRARLAESDKLTRDVAVKELVTSWQGYSDSEVTAARVSTLVQYGATWELLSKDYVPCVPVLAVVKAFSLAAWRNTTMEASRKEEWLLTAKTADAVKALWREAGEASLPGTACDKALRDILGMPKPEAKADTKPATATTEATEAKADAPKADAKPATPEAEETTPATPPCAQPVVQLLKGASQATVKDLAGQLSDMLMAHPEPDSVLEELFAQLSNNPDLSRPMQRAVKAAMLTLLNASKPGQQTIPVGGQVPPAVIAALLPTKAELSNGHVTAVA